MNQTKTKAPNKCDHVLNVSLCTMKSDLSTYCCVEKPMRYPVKM